MTGIADKIETALVHGHFPEVIDLATRALADVSQRDDELAQRTAARLRQVITAAENGLLLFADDMAVEPFTPTDEMHRSTRAHRAYLTSVAQARRAARHWSYSTHPSNPGVRDDAPDPVEHTTALDCALSSWDLWHLAGWLSEHDDGVSPFVSAVVRELVRIAGLHDPAPACRHVRRQRRTRSHHSPGRTALSFHLSAQAPPRPSSVCDLVSHSDVNT